MTPAPVGQHCPDCVNEGKKTVRQVRTVLGGRPISRPTVTYALIGINVVAFIAAWSTGLDKANGNLGMWPVGIGYKHEYYRLFTSMFMHASITHIAFNMIVLWIIGQQLEVLLGHSRFITLYFVSGLAGAVASFYFSDIRTLAVGASGAIFGLMGGLLVAGRRLRYDVTQVAALIGINIVFGFLWPGTDWKAHLGGLVGGLLMGLVYAHGPKRNRLVFELGCTVVIVAVLVGLIAIRSHQIVQLVG